MLCATKQHTGKTSVSLGLISAARAGRSVGYMKPVGQTWVEVADNNGVHRVDKDAAVAHRYFGLQVCPSQVSPIVISAGMTKKYLDGEAPELSQQNVKSTITRCFDAISAATDIVIVEGTGHCGVGTVIGWNNARVAATLGIDVVLVANGGIGSTVDELALNVLACRAEGANIAGVIINKVHPSKVDQVTRYIERASALLGWNVPVLATVPYAENLCAKMSADDQQAVRSVVECYEPHLGQCVERLFGEPAQQQSIDGPGMMIIEPDARRTLLGAHRSIPGLAISGLAWAERAADRGWGGATCAHVRAAVA